MTRTTVALLIAAALFPVTGATQAGQPMNEPEPVQPLSLSGPRFGFTYLSPGIQERVEEFSGYAVLPVVTQFGWQWETRFFSLEEGATASAATVH